MSGFYDALRDAFWDGFQWVPRSELLMARGSSARSEQRIHNPQVAGSNPAPATNPAWIAFQRLLNMGVE